MAATTLAAIQSGMTRREEEMWCDLVERRCGICFSNARFYVLHNCLARQMQERGFERYGDYYALVLRSGAEWGSLVDRLVNRETSFFRDMPSFTALAEELLPSIIANKTSRRSRRVALWSAGCSSGEEAYSLAITASETTRPDDLDIRILGSDLSTEAVTAARRARYLERSVAAVPEMLQRKYFTKHGSEYELKPATRTLVQFETFNFFDPVTYPAVHQDVIFCQNVFIYFREEMRLQAAAGLAACLRPGGYLVTAPGELAGLRVPGLERVQLRHMAVLRRNADELPNVPGVPGAAAEGGAPWAL
jgi:chemotaxis methyl-accepting protein methylase